MSKVKLKDCTIGDLGKIVTGKTPSTKEDLYWGDKVIFLTPRDMKGNKNIYDTERKLTDLGAKSVNNYILPTNSICVSCIGTDMGKVVKLKKHGITNQQINSIIVNEDNNCDYVYYLMTYIYNEIRSLGNTSTAVPIVNKSTFSSIKIKVHEIKQQEKIANLLSALDNKIEINNQINKDLEEIAQALYTKWFVNFDFPNEEGKPYKSSGGKMIDSELGNIPVGWSVGNIRDYFDFIKGTEVGSSNYLENPLYNTIRFIRVGDMETLDSNIYVYKYLTKDIFCSPKDVLISMDGSVGRVVNGLSGCYSSGIRNVVAKNEVFNSKGFIYLLLKSERTQYTINQFAHGSIIKHASKAINYIKFIVPSEQRINEFNNIVEPLYNQIIENKLENQQLKETRDLLLPYLMSGKVVIG